jgi:hypothetical protein
MRRNAEGRTILKIAIVATEVTGSLTRRDRGQMSELLPARNRLLASLRSADPAAEARLRVGLESVELKGHAKVMTSDRPIRHVYFPETGVLAVIQQMHNGSAVAVDLVGSDGMVGLAVYLGGVTFPLEAICQAPGTFLRMKAAEFRAEVARNAQLLKVLHGYTHGALQIAPPRLVLAS